MEDVHTIVNEPAIVHCSSIIETENKDLLCVWYQGSYETSGDTKIMVKRKGIDNPTWENAKVLFDFNGIPLGNPVLWKHEGILYITFSVLMSESWKSSLLFYACSHNNGITWSKPSLFTPTKGLMPKTQPLETSSGDILFPLYHEAEYCPYVMIIQDLDKVIFSPLVAETMARNKAIQPALCSLSDGRILMYCRTNQGTIWKSISYNNGYSWSICEPTNLLNPDSAVDLEVIDDTLFLVSNLSSKDRHALTLSISSDQGETWKLQSIIAEGSGEYSYPCMIKDSKKSIHITYTENRYSIKHVELTYDRLGL